ncbi:MAG: carotenoid oxygenase family protein [Janthinobacterium lividum]
MLSTSLDAPSYADNQGPIDFETALQGLPVTGELPAALQGALFRNGPNPVDAQPGEHWFLGDGMLHSLHFSDGAVAYRNRWVRTQRWQAQQAGQAVPLAFGSSAGKPAAAVDSDGVANTNVLMHAGRLLALEEAHLPIQIEPLSLATCGSVDFDGRVQGAFTAHPKIDAATGELLFFGYGTPARLGQGMAYGVIAATGEVTRFEHFDAPYASMVHDFMATEHHVMFPVLPLVGDLDRARAGGPAFAWEPERGSCVGVMRRDQGVETIEWWRGASCYVFHVMNAWEQGDCLYADVMQFERPPLFPSADGTPATDLGGAYLVRWTFDLSASCAGESTGGYGSHEAGGSQRVFSQQVLLQIPGEFPRIDDRYAGRPYRHGWFAGHAGAAERDVFRLIVHVDHTLSAPDVYTLPLGDATSEPVFVPRDPGAPEGEGWLLAVVYRGDEDRSDVLVFDALRVAKGPLATVALPHRVPNGFHGNWVPASQLLD